ncbi:MAG TPA: hypothetical protein PKC69_01425 [Chitinophagaceae bacterium]|nr:hypothetical protein [Chitinophagaceae bacterium]
MKVSEALSKTLFWDVDPEKLDWERNRQLIIERTLVRGMTKEVNHVFSVYSEEEIRKAVLKSRSLDKKSANYFSIKLNIPIHQLHVAPEHY